MSLFIAGELDQLTFNCLFQLKRFCESKYSLLLVIQEGRNSSERSVHNLEKIFVLIKANEIMMAIARLVKSNILLCLGNGILTYRRLQFLSLRVTSVPLLRICISTANISQFLSIGFLSNMLFLYIYKLSKLVQKM